MKTRTLLTAIIAALLLSLPALAQPPAPADMPAPPGAPCWGMGPGMGMMGAHDGFCKGLDLSDEQQAKLEKLRLEHAKAMMNHHTDAQALHNKIKQLIIADKYDKGAVDKTASDLAELHAKAAKMRAEHLRQVRNLLTDEQRVKFDQNVLTGGPMDKSKFKQHKAKGMHHGRCGPGRPF